ncbi:MAG: hypothetical protein J1F35_03490 [Erysipelotrichales bacterium]|nr:hypothetical protein [Erysipelotrichales bacterium]
MRRRSLMVENGPCLTGTIKTSNYDVGNIVLYDREEDKKIVIDINNPAEKFPISRYNPLAVIVIPSSHDVYGTGEAGAMSLVNMSCDTPNDGGIENNNICYGMYNVDTILANHERTKGPRTEDRLVYLPTDDLILNNEYFASNDPLSWFHNSISVTKFGYSPYDADGISRSKEYYQPTSYSLNALSDFDGINNTNILINLFKQQTTWKIDDNILNNYQTGYTPAACCCWRFCPEGSKQGEWYLPGCGELGYVVPRRKIINSSLLYLKDLDQENIIIKLLAETNENLLSSTEESSTYARVIRFSINRDDAFYQIKSKSVSVRAFIRIK